MHSCFPGKFTATIAGVYTFTLSARSGDGANFQADVFVEKVGGEEVMICGSAYSTGPSTPGSCTVVYELGEINLRIQKIKFVDFKMIKQTLKKHSVILFQYSLQDYLI